jgi:hypothetical protein
MLFAVKENAGDQEAGEDEEEIDSNPELSHVHRVMHKNGENSESANAIQLANSRHSTFRSRGRQEERSQEKTPGQQNLWQWYTHVVFVTITTRITACCAILGLQSRGESRCPCSSDLWF